MKECTKCGENPRVRGHTHCNTCRANHRREYNRMRTINDPSFKPKRAVWSRSYRYGLTEDQHTELWAQQGGVCAICLTEPEGRALNVDHDHETGKVRALLCGSCNRGLGLLKERPYLLRRAAEYLEEVT